MSLFPIIPPRILATVEDTASGTAAANQTSYTFSTLSFGAAQGDRYIIVAAGVGDGDNDNRQISGITIGGVAGTLVVHRFVDGLTATADCAIYIANVPSGTTGDVVVATSGSGTAGNCAVVVYRATGINPTATDTANASGLTPDLSIDVVENGIAIACLCAYDNGSVTWSGITEDFDSDVENGLFSSASRTTDTTQAGLSVSATSATSGAQPTASVSASFRPA